MIFFVGSTPISWTSKRQGTIESSSYSAEFCAGQVASEEAIAIRYMLRSLGVPMLGATALCGDNLGMIMSSTNPDLELKKKHVAISFHKLRECAAAGIINLIKVCTMVNRADILTKGTSAGTLGSLSRLVPYAGMRPASRSLWGGQCSSVDIAVRLVCWTSRFCQAYTISTARPYSIALTF